METIGIIGGLGPESTIDYYRQIVARYREQQGDGSYPPIIINSIDLTRLRGFFETNELGKATEYLVSEVQRLARAGAECGLLSANTPHIVFDEVSQQSPIPLVSIVEATCQAAKELGLRRLGLFGTRFTMQGRFYPDVFSREGLTLIAPEPAEQAHIHDKYFAELVNGIFSPETRKQFLGIADRMIEREKIQGLILGGTELPLLLRQATYQGIPLLDTTRIHVQAVVAKARSI